MNNKNQTERVPEFHASFRHRPIICCSFAGCREMQPCPQGKVPGSIARLQVHLRLLQSYRKL